MADGFERAWELAKDVNGWYSREELEFLWNQLQALEPLSSVLEIGCYYGRSTATIAEVCARRGATLWIIDPFHHRGVDVPEAQDSVMEIIEKSDVSCHLIKNKTCEVIPESLPNNFDAVHIDGSHEAEDVALDCQLALPKLRSGGIVAFHDWADYKPGVALGAGPLVKNWGTVGQAGSVRIFRKP